MKKVFIVNDSGHDFSQAQEFGELKTLTKGSVAVFSTDRTTSFIKEELKRSSSDDYILLSGNSVLSIIAFNIMLDLHKKVNLLIYNFEIKKYIEREFTFDSFKIKEG